MLYDAAQRARFVEARSGRPSSASSGIVDLASSVVCVPSGVVDYLRERAAPVADRLTSPVAAVHGGDQTKHERRPRVGARPPVAHLDVDPRHRLGHEPVDVEPAVGAERLQHELPAVADHAEGPSLTAREHRRGRHRTGSGRAACRGRSRRRRARAPVGPGDPKNEAPRGTRRRRRAPDANAGEHRLDLQPDVLERRGKQKVVLEADAAPFCH